MGVVTPKQLGLFMNGREWSPEQVLSVGIVLDGLENTLEGRLYGAWITPRATSEVAPILDSGLVATRQPVHAVTRIDGVVVDAEHPLAAPWTLERHRLRTSTVSPSVLSLSSPWDTGRAHSTGGVVGRVAVEYLGGWGPEPAIVRAILRKAGNWASNWTSDEVRVSDVDAQEPAPLAEEWTAGEIAALGIYRNLTAVRRAAVRR